MRRKCRVRELFYSPRAPVNPGAALRVYPCMSPFQVLVLLVVVVPPAWAGYAVGRSKGRRGAGFALGLLLCWIGVIVIALVPPTYAEKVRREAERLRIQQDARGSLGMRY